MRYLGVDYGAKRIGLALSDATGLIARPWQTVPANGSPGASALAIAGLLADRADETLAEVGAVVVGLPRRLNGEETKETAAAREFARLLKGHAGLAVHLQDERLTSHEAEARLARTEPDWRRRKPRLDAASAEIILQDYLDGRPAADREERA